MNEARTRSTAGRRPVGKVRPADTRRHHRALILQQLVDEGARSRADLARETSLTRVTISDLVAELIDEGFVSELGTRPGTHMGKPATLVGISEDAPVTIALDLSADGQLSGGVVDLDGHILAREQVPFVRGDDLSVISDLAIRLQAATTRRILGVGIGTPGIVDAAGTVVLAPNLGWTDLDLTGELSKAIGLPVHAGNDANVAAVAESAFGAGDDGGLLLLTVGQGVGGGVMIDGRALSGPLQSAGEIGHVVVDPDGRQCACGNRGCLETFLAAPALRQLDSDAARAEVGTRLASVLTPVVTTLGIADVVLYGPAELLEGALLDAVRSALAHQTLPFVAQRVQIRLAPLDDELVLTGAAALVRYRELGVV
ncbi:ROK family protein [Aeromicrobium ginsengisoli]|uniref:ROK family protein n=1 Tax=Aeromicrobium ginsengisoli TaxID=363867 RepID=A0A5M4FGA3_9ACTN|nr:ROK family protein [Aeromicrobium ginsengisoli]